MMFSNVYRFILSTFAFFVAYNFITLDFDPQVYSVADDLPASFHGENPGSKSKFDERLSKVSNKIKLHGPEAFVLHDGIIYTGLLAGHIVKIHPDGKVSEFTRTGLECEGMWEEAKCGRPLGLTIDSKGEFMYVADAFKGLLKINMITKEKVNILATGTLIDGKPLTLPNNVVLDEANNLIYLTDSSTKWSLDKIVYYVLERKPSGRLVRYDVETGKATTLVENLLFANGLEFADNKKSLLIAETFTFKIHKYWIETSKLEVFASKLPGMPDNIRPSPRGGYWVGMAMAINSSHPGILQQIGPYIYARKLFVSVSHTLASAARAFVRYSPLKLKALLILTDKLERMQYVYATIKPHGIIVRINDEGKIVQTLHSSCGEPAFVSEAFETKNQLLIGSFINEYAAVLEDYK